MEPIVYLVSDLHLGPGRDAATGEWNALEDFRADEAFCAFLDTISATDGPIELIIAGDFIDYPQVLPELGPTSPADHLGTTEEESLERTRVVLGQRPQVASGHPAVFERLRRFMVDGHSITILAGNHDIDILWPRVWALLFDTIYPPGSSGVLQRQSFSYIVGRGPRGRIYIEHGNEHDPTSRFGDQMSAPFASDADGVLRLKRCWGTLFLDKVYNQLERERWFIDNVKPILRVIQLGLRNDFPFTATALALLVKFLLSNGLPPSALSAGVLAAEGQAWPKHLRASEAVVDAVADDELRRYLERRMADPAFRAAFEEQVQGFSEAEWQAISVGAAQQPTLDEAVAKTAGAGAEGAAVLGLFGGADEYQQAAREILERDPSISTVVMGHTHAAIDGLVAPFYLSGQRTGYYFNSGTWTPHLRERPDDTYSWQEIADPANYTSLLTYLRLVPDQQGAYRAELHNWSAEWSG